MCHYYHYDKVETVHFSAIQASQEKKKNHYDTRKAGA